MLHSAPKYIPVRKGVSRKWQPLIIAPFLFTILSGCASTPPIERETCSAFEAWIEAGPRIVTHDRRIILPNSNECYGSTAPDEIIITCLTTNLDCPKNIECEDTADTLFKKVLYRRAHSWTEYDYFEVFNICLGTIKKRTSAYSDASKVNQTYSIVKNKTITKLDYDAKEKRVKIVIQYAAPSPF